ncbi:phage recombination protein Bet [Phreatobacter sp. HK31-P]
MSASALAISTEAAPPISAPLPITQARQLGWTPRQIDLIKRNQAADLTGPEFDFFIEVARRSGHDPLLNEITAVVLNKHDPARRSVLHIVKIQGLRARAAREKNYRPDEEEFELHFDERLKDIATNPLGIDRCVVRVWKLDDSGVWNKITGVAHWDEYAPVREIWTYDREAEKNVPTGRYEIDRKGLWPRMGRHMIAKCAEANALAKGWPDQTAGVYAEESVDKERFLDLSATEMMEEDEKRRITRVGPKAESLMIDWLDPSKPIEHVAIPELFDRVVSWLQKDCQSAEDITTFKRQNRPSLEGFKAKDPSRFLAMKVQWEEAEARLTPAGKIDPRLETAMKVAPTMKRGSEFFAERR